MSKIRLIKKLKLANLGRFCVLWLIFFLAKTAHGSEQEVFRYRRCYSQFTRMRVSEKDPAIREIRKRKLNGTKACLNLLHSARLDNNGDLKQDSVEGREVLKTFQSFNRGFFQEYELNVLTGDYADTDFFDVNEMGYHLTYALFGPEYPFSKIVTSERSFAGVRKAEAQPKWLFDDSLGEPRLRKHGWDLGEGRTKSEPNLLSFGTLTGIRVSDGPGTKVKFTDRNAYVEVAKSQGAGVIGTIPYLLLNSGQISGAPDGGLLAHRRWSKAIFRDLLCRDLPVIAVEDAVPFIKKESPILFQRDQKCMQCHASMDNMAANIRNFELFHTVRDNQWSSLRGVYKHPVDIKSSEFYRSPPQGRILFRNFENRLIDIETDSLFDLGEKISQLDDLYLCAASRYFTFLTGHEFKIDSDFTEKVKIEGSKSPGRFLLNLASDFRKHQSVAKLIGDIVESSFYLERP